MKKIILLLGYLAGIIVGSKFAKKHKGKGKKPETLGDWARDAGEEIVAVHKRLLDTTKDEYWTDEKKEYLFEKKEALMMFLEDFKAEALEKIDDLKESSSQLSTKGQTELKKIYDNRAEYLEKASHLSKKALAGAQAKLDETFDDIKAKVESKKPASKKPVKKTIAKKKPASKK